MHPIRALSWPRLRARSSTGQSIRLRIFIHHFQSKISSIYLGKIIRQKQTYYFSKLTTFKTLIENGLECSLLYLRIPICQVVTKREQMISLELMQRRSSRVASFHMAMKIKTKQLDENRRLEIYAVINFIAAYRRLFGGWPPLVDMPKPPEPDFIIQLDARELGVEVAHLYGSERDARLLKGHSRPKESTHRARVEHAMVPLYVRVPSELNRILSQKATKAYPRRTWL